MNVRQPLSRPTGKATKQHADGGTAESVLFVLPKLVFTDRDDPSIERTFDTAAERLEDPAGDYNALFEEFTRQGCDRCDPRLFSFGELALPECQKDLMPQTKGMAAWKKWIPQRRHRRERN